MNQTTPTHPPSPTRSKSSSQSSFYSAYETDSPNPQLFDFSSTRKSAIKHNYGEWNPQPKPAVRRPDRHLSVKTTTSSVYSDRPSVTSYMMNQLAPPSIQTGMLASPVTFKQPGESSRSSVNSDFTTLSSPLSLQSKGSFNAIPAAQLHPSTNSFLSVRDTMTTMESLSALSQQELEKQNSLSEKNPVRFVPVRDFSSLSYTLRLDDETQSVLMFDDPNLNYQDLTGHGFPKSESPQVKNSPRQIARVLSMTSSKESYPTIFGENNEKLPTGTSGAFPIYGSASTPVTSGNANSNLIDKKNFGSIAATSRPFMPHIYRMVPPSGSEEEYVENMEDDTEVTPASALESSISQGDKKSFEGSGLDLSSNFLHRNSQIHEHVVETHLHSPTDLKFSANTSPRVENFERESVKPSREKYTPYAEKSLFATRTSNRGPAPNSGMLPPVNRNSRAPKSIVITRSSISSMSNLIDDPQMTKQKNLAFAEDRGQVPGAVSPLHTSSEYTNAMKVFRDYEDSPNGSSDLEKSKKTSRIRKDLEFLDRFKRPLAKHTGPNDEEINATADAARAYLDDASSQNTAAGILYQKTRQFDMEGNPICSDALEIFMLITFAFFPPFWLLLGTGIFDSVVNTVSRKTKQTALILAGLSFTVVCAGFIVGIAVGGSSG